MNEQSFYSDDGYDNEQESFDDSLATATSGAYDDSEGAQAEELLTLQGDDQVDAFMSRITGFTKRHVVPRVRNLLKAQGKDLLRKALPAIGTAAGNWIAPGVGGRLGGAAGSALGQLLGKEAEAFAEAELRTATARRIVRTLRDAHQRALNDPGLAANPQAAVEQAYDVAIRRGLPGLRAAQLAAAGEEPSRVEAQGRWVRRNGVVVLMGL
jgi:hypothetical protein